MKFASILLQLATLCGLLIALSPPGVAQNRAAPVAIGEEAPDFTLESHQAKQITLSEARKKSPVVLVFYRGYW